MADEFIRRVESGNRLAIREVARLDESWNRPSTQRINGSYRMCESGRGKGEYAMNKLRRKSLEEIEAKIDELRDLLEALRDEEQEYADNMPENLQGSERHEQAEDAVYSMDCALDNLSDAIDNIDEAMN